MALGSRAEPGGGLDAAPLPWPGGEPRRAPIEALTAINTGDLLEALGLGGVRRGRRLLELLCRRPARRFAEQVAAYDRLVGERGLGEGAVWALQRLVGRLEVAGRAQVPTEGPLLVVANHPSLSDSLALFASLPRADLRVVARERPFLQALPATGRSLISLPEQADGRLAVTRRVIGHLRQGGAVLAFPRGEIEPDPALLPGAVESLGRWSKSIGLFVRLAPRSRVVPAIVSGVLSPAAQRHPLTRLRRLPRDRELLGAMLQVVVPAYQAVTVRVAFGRPIAAAELLAAGPDAGAIAEQIIEQARRLIREPRQGWETLVERVSG